MNRWRCALFVFLYLSLSPPATAQQPTTQLAPPTPRLQGLSPTDADALIGTLVQAQRDLKGGKKVFFELLSGAPAYYDQTRVAPRQAFLDLHFEHPDVIERLPPPNGLWQPYKLTYFGKRGNELMWEVEVVLGYGGALERVQMIYKPPPPF